MYSSNVSRHTLNSLRNKMADISLDELIRRRGFNTRGISSRPLLRRGAGAVGRTLFDARQKIGVTDAREKIGGAGVFPVQDAREKLVQKDARFRIRGRGTAGAIQDARQMINSRKQQQAQSTTQLQTHSSSHLTHPQQVQLHSSSVTTDGHSTHGPKKLVDARERLSLKRSIAVALPNLGSPLPIKITKTIQQRPVGMTSGVRVNVPNRNSQSLSSEHDDITRKQMKITTANNFAHTKPGAISSPFSMSAPITKVVQNDSYTAPPPATPAAPSRSSPAQEATRTAPAAIQPVSRTLVTGQQGAGEGSPSAQPAAPQPAFSPLEGTKMTVNNLHPRVTEEDIVELFCVCGALKRARLLKVGVAEVVFVRKEDAITAYRKYNNRCLDGKPMKCNLHIQGNVITSDQPILLGRASSSQPTPEVDPQTILKALFKSSPQVTSSTESTSMKM
ncbi:polymerase delta-interacting protein 3-like [Arapaima gigas]